MAGALGVIVGVTFGFASACGSDEPPTPGHTQSGSGNVICDNNSSCTIEPEQAQDIVKDAEGKAGDSDAKLKKSLRGAPGATEPPGEPGPYPFTVVDTANLGLFARTTNVVNGVRVGNTGNRELVWANCVAQSDFTPSDVSGENNVGPQWVQVRWKHLGSGQTRGLSEPNETQTAWMYRGALEPVGHNGEIPGC